MNLSDSVTHHDSQEIVQRIVYNNTVIVKNDWVSALQGIMQASMIASTSIGVLVINVATVLVGYPWLGACCFLGSCIVFISA